MKATFYVRYAARSLARGGQRTLLAVFCIAAGVMAIVGLQLVSEMARQAISGNARAVNQGDVSIGLSATPIQVSDLSFFAALKANGVIGGFTPQVNSAGIMQVPNGRRHTVSVRVVDPATFPLIGSGALERPTGESVAQLLRQDGSAVISSRLAEDLRTPIGASVRVLTLSGTVATLKLAGIAATDNATWAGNSLTVSAATWETATKSPVAFQTVAIITRDSARTQQATSAIRRQYPLASIRTTDDILRQAEQGVETTRRFLVLIGLLALLIGGAGVVNTMQVLLMRRRVEIAVLKTTGYRRRDLYFLFAIEAALLGVAGGICGALLGIAVAAGLRAAVVRAFPVVLPFVLSPSTVLGGIAIGVSTALIFGLLPIVRAASLRPQAVFRDSPEWQGTEPLLQTAALLFVLSALFVALASAILKSLIWGAVAVYGFSALILVISLVLGGMLELLSRLPVPDRLTVRYTVLVTSAALVPAAMMRVATVRGVGFLLLVFVLLGYASPFLPASWRLSLRLSLRNVGRTRVRTAATVLALLIGVFSVGLILVLGQDLRANLGRVFSTQLRFNVIAVSTDPSQTGLSEKLRRVPGLLESRAGTYVPTTAVEIGSRPITAFGGGSGRASAIRQQLRQLSGIQGYDVGAGDVPGSTVEITAGRNLGAEDAGTSNVIVQDSLRDAPLRLGLGSSLRLKRPNGAASDVFTVVGFYRLASAGPGPNFSVAPVFGPETATARLAGELPLQIFYLRVAEDRVPQAMNRIQQLEPDLIVVDLEDFLTQFTQVLDNILLLLTAIASLALIAGVIIVANAVALAMLERRRELAILKSTGYSSRRVLVGVLTENMLTAGLGGVLGMAPVSVAVLLFSRQAGVSFGVGAPISIAIVLGVVLLTSLTTALVAWGTVRVRPLSVLRYE